MLGKLGIGGLVLPPSCQIEEGTSAKELEGELQSPRADSVCHALLRGRGLDGVGIPIRQGDDEARVGIDI